MKHVLSVLALFAALGASVAAAELKVGTAKADITPEKSVPLWGQFGLRLSQGVKSPISANVCAVESVENGSGVDAAIFASVDCVHIPTAFAQIVRDKVVAKDNSIKPEKIILFATHTHTAPTLYEGPRLPKGDHIEDYPETIETMSTKIADAIVAAWQARQPADFSWGLEQTVIGQSRRACYFDGRAQMYGNPDDPNFSHYENPTDPDLGTLFFWNKEGKLLSIIINVACPSQVMEHLSVICADHWGVTRPKLNERFGQDVVIVACKAPAGDDSPHPQYRQAALARMRMLRFADEKELSADKRESFQQYLRAHDSEMFEIARRIDRAVADSYECAVKDKMSDVPFAHVTETLQLPMRHVTEAEYNECKAQRDAFQKALDDNPDKTPAEVAFMGIGWFGSIVDRYEAQQAGQFDTFPASVHVIRIGDVAIATDQFELFVDYSMRIKTRSKAMATFVMDLADGDGAYMPTAKAIQGGGYSAVIQSDPVSAEGGQMLVNETLRMIESVWK